MKRILLLVLMAVCCLLFTACYTEIDPWPEVNLSSTSTPTPVSTVTAVPATAVPPTAVPFTPPPAVTAEPLPEDAVDVSPNFNG